MRSKDDVALCPDLIRSFFGEAASALPAAPSREPTITPEAGVGRRHYCQRGASSVAVQDSSAWSQIFSTFKLLFDDLLA